MTPPPHNVCQRCVRLFHLHAPRVWGGSGERTQGVPEKSALSSWLERMSSQCTCSSDLLSKLDKSTTSIVLNTVEGNGRFSGTDQAKFLGIAYRATVQSATLVDLTTADCCPADPSPVEEGRDLLRRIAAMLRQLSKAVRDDI